MGTVASRTCVPYDTINSAGCTSLRRYVGYVASRRDGKLNVKVHDTRQTFSRMQRYISLGDHKFALFHVGECSAVQWEYVV